MEKITEKEIKQLPLEKLEEMLHRQEHLMKKCCVLSKLIDKGASVRKMHQLLKDEIESRKLIENFSRIELKADQSLDKHAEYVCSRESIEVNDRFKPFDTLRDGTAHARHGKIGHSDISAAVEPNWSNLPAKRIPLKESLELQEQHVKKLKEEQAKRLVNAVEVVEGSVDDDEEKEKETEPVEALVLTSEDLSNVL